MRLAKWRREKGLTQEELAQQIGCTQPYISSLERAVDPAVPQRDIIRKIYIVTRGAVDANDLVFPDGLPDLSQAQLALPLSTAPLFERPANQQAGSVKDALLERAA